MDKQAKDFEKGWEEYKEKKAKAVEEMKNDIYYQSSLTLDESKELAKKLVRKYQPKIPEGAVVLTREELSERDYEFRKIGYEDCRKSFPERDKYIKTLETKIVELEVKLDKARKETAEKFAELKTVWKQRAKNIPTGLGTACKPLLLIGCLKILTKQ